MKHHIIAFAVLSLITIPVLTMAQDANYNAGDFGSSPVPGTYSSVNQPNVNSTSAPTPTPVPAAKTYNTSIDPNTGLPYVNGASDVVAGNAPPATPPSNPLNAVSSGPVKLENPLNVKSIPEFFYLIINFVYSLSYAVIAVFLLISGFKFVMAQGKPDALEDAKKTFKYTIVGAILLISANVITEVVRTIINRFVTTSI